MALNRLRWKLVLVFLAATLLPLGATLWVSSALMQRSLAFVNTDDLARLSASLETVAREYYRQAREDLRADAAASRIEPDRLVAATGRAWPDPVREFLDSGEAERFVLSEPDGEELHYLVRHGGDVWHYSRRLDGVRMGDVTRLLHGARARAGALESRDLPRGFTIALLVAGAAIWALALAGVVFMSSRISAPIEQLTAGLSELSQGRFETRLAAKGDDEVGRAIHAFNDTAARLQENRSRLVYLTQVASWQMLARKMAHELKNSLTPIRLTVEEILARHPPSPAVASAGTPAAEPAFLQQAARIVADEVDSLERRVRAFSEFAAEPPNNPAALDLNVLLEERVQLLRVAHPEVTYRIERDAGPLVVWVDADQVKGILTNLLENAAEAAGAGGVVLALTGGQDRNAVVEVHDSGPGLSADARRMLFEPTISFKQHGMGLGLAISRKNALVAGGDLSAIEGRLRGAAFRLVVPQVGGER
jgi:two-component system, NtrC family, nitrogen regulation sensor histidine kinase NtrY